MSIQGCVRTMLVAGAMLSLLGAGVAPVIAQQGGTIQGTVVDASTGRGLAGVQVSVAGTEVRGITGPEGAYRLLGVPVGTRTITATRVGYGTGTQTVTVTAGGTAAASFQLNQTATELEGLVVTALGITREERAVPTAIAQISGEELSSVETNIVNTLSGKVAGVTITNAGPQGGSSRIVIRGENSITGENQPLWVVDGVPIDNASPRLYGYGGRDYGNAVQDINPENIASISVLKGPNAAALYGSRASNGAIIVTTKSGRGATRGQVTASQQVTFESPLRLPAWQNQFGQGYLFQFEYYDGFGHGRYDDWDESWGPPLDGRLIPQYNSPLVNGVRQPTPWVANPDNVNDYFETGLTLNTNVAFAAASERANVRLSASHLNQGGMVPGFEMERTTLGLNGGADIGERLSANASVQYITSDNEGRPGTGYDETNPMEQFIWFGRQVDIRDLRANVRTIRGPGDPQEGMFYSWNYSYHPNPFFQQFVNQNTDSRDRLIGSAGLNYKFADWLTGTVRGGTDWYQDDRKGTYAAGNYSTSITDPLTGAGLNIGANGAFNRWQIGFQETNLDALLTATPQLTDAISLNATIGANRRDYRRNTDYVYVGDLIAPGIYSVENALVTPDPYDFLSRKRTNSILGAAEFGFNDFLFLTLTGRNDWSSTLPDENNSYFYPSISGALVFTDALNTDLGGLLSYGKLRASWARVGKDTDPYELRNTLGTSNPFDGFPTFAVPNSLANAELRPEQTESWEFGTDLRFLNDRATLDLTYYNEVTSDQIMPVQISRASGFNSTVINAGKMQNRGWEARLTGSPIARDNGFRWETTLTFSKNNNKVLELTEDVEGLQLATYWGMQIWAREGEPFGQMFGTPYVRDSQGSLVVDALGRPQLGAELVQLGNYQADWQGGWSNTVGYKGVNLHFLIDTRQGGDIYSVTSMWGRYAGVLEETLAGRCRIPNSAAYPAVEGVPLCDASNGIIVPGVKVVNGDTVPNDIVTNAIRYNKALYDLEEAHVFDASFVKLREVTLSYQVPGAFTRRLGVSGLNLSVVGRNLALWTNVPHIDPETAFDASNVQGFEFGQLPTPRSIGFNISVTP